MLHDTAVLVGVVVVTHLSSSELELHSEEEDVPDPEKRPRLRSAAFFSLLSFLAFRRAFWRGVEVVHM